MTTRPVALATGAGHRLGRALAVGLARGGYDVAVHFRSSEADAAETLRLVREAGGGGSLFSADLARAGAARALANAVFDRHGRVDALVHAASPWIEKPFGDVTAEDWDATMATGPGAGFFLAQALHPALRAAAGAVVLVSDVAALQAWPRHIPNAVSKAAVNALVRNLAVAMAPEVRVNGVMPGVVLPPADMDDEAVARLVSRTPLRRRVPVDDVVASVLHLLANRSITGQILAVDAGRSVA